MIITKHGKTKLNKNKNFLGDLPFFSSIVHENVDGFKPSCPHMPSTDGN